MHFHPMQTERYLPVPVYWKPPPQININMKESANHSLQVTGFQMKENQKNIEGAMQNMQSLSRVNDMAAQILEITDQTDMLAHLLSC